MPRKPHSQSIESEFIQLEDGSQIHWDKWYVKDHRYTVFQVTCGLCGKTREVLDLLSWMPLEIAKIIRDFADLVILKNIPLHVVIQVLKSITTKVFLLVVTFFWSFLVLV